jgi:hypothetical protein
MRYDPIGNRKWYQGDGIEGALTYTTNSLNQYTATSQPAEAPALDTPDGYFVDFLNGYVDELRISRGLVAEEEQLNSNPPLWPTTATVEGAPSQSRPKMSIGPRLRAVPEPDQNVDRSPTRFKEGGSEQRSEP